VYYFENWGFDVSFETQVGRELSEFLADFDDRRDGFWAARVDGCFAGACAIDGHSTAAARLRWFIVDPRFQRQGIGSGLLSRAIEFCRNQAHNVVNLWTFVGLDPARRLYEGAGFVLAEQSEIQKWGSAIKEQKFELIL
jgi:GNAT superfamily N-acetyltransferase